MLRPAHILFAAAAAILLAAGDSFAQGGRSGGGSSLGSGASSFGGSSLGGGQSAFGGSSLGQSGFGQSGFGQSGFGQSGFGQSGMGQSAFGQSSFGSGQQTGALGAQGGNPAFIGRGAADIANMFGGAANQTGQTTQRSQRAGGGNNRNSSDSSSSTRPEVRVTVTASPELQRFVAANRPPAAVTISNVSRALARRGMNGVNFVTEDGVATLDGTVTNAADKLLAEKLAAIEPGVRRVDNRLVIQADAEEIFP
jgi:hypothetical protein